jgi:hypothetical protein
MWRPFRWVLAVLLFMNGLLAGIGPSASAHRAGSIGSRTITVSDPMDVEPCDLPPWSEDCPIDIRTVSKRSFRNSAGRRMLAVRLEAYRLYGGLIYVANIRVRFDATGGPRPDGQMFFALTDVPGSLGWACGRRWDLSGSLKHRYRLRVDGDQVTCVLPMRELRPTKRIRFNATSRWWQNDVVDRAPDQGWSFAGV